MLAAVLALSACGQGSGPAPLAFPREPFGGIEIKYPLDETLFPPEIVAPTFVWSDTTARRRKVDGPRCDSTARTRCGGSRRRSPAGDPRRPIGTRSSSEAWTGTPAWRSSASARRRGRLCCDPPHPYVQGPGRRLHLLSRGSAPVHHGRTGPLAHPLALRVDRLAGPASHRPRGPAGLRELPLLLGRRRRPGPRRRLRQRQGGLCDPPRVQADGAERREDHHLDRLQERRRRDYLRAAFQGLSRRPLRDQYGQGPRGVRGDARHLVFAALLPDQGHSRRIRHRETHLQGVARRRRPRVRAEQPDVEPGRKVDRLRPDEGVPEGCHRQCQERPAGRKGRPRVRQRQAAVQVRSLSGSVQRWPRG